MTIVTCRWPGVATPGTITTPINNIKYLFRRNLDNIISINNSNLNLCDEGKGQKMEI